MLADLSKAPVPKQIAVGGAAGWTAGYLTMKAGKMAATAIGGTLLLLQIAHHKGYIKVQSQQQSCPILMRKCSSGGLEEDVQ